MPVIDPGWEQEKAAAKAAEKIAKFKAKIAKFKAVYGADAPPLEHYAPPPPVKAQDPAWDTEELFPDSKPYADLVYTAGNIPGFAGAVVTEFADFKFKPSHIASQPGEYVIMPWKPAFQPAEGSTAAMDIQPFSQLGTYLTGLGAVLDAGLPPVSGA